MCLRVCHLCVRFSYEQNHMWFAEFDRCVHFRAFGQFGFMFRWTFGNHFCCYFLSFSFRNGLVYRACMWRKTKYYTQTYKYIGFPLSMWACVNVYDAWPDFLTYLNCRSHSLCLHKIIESMSNDVVWLNLPSVIEYERAHACPHPCITKNIQTTDEWEKIYRTY